MVQGSLLGQVLHNYYASLILVRLLYQLYFGYHQILYAMSASQLRIRISSSSDVIPHFIPKANIQHFNISYHILNMYDIEYHKSILCCQYLATCLQDREDY